MVSLRVVVRFNQITKDGRQTMSRACISNLSADDAEGVFIFELRRKQIAGVCLQNRPDLVNNVPRLTFSCVVKVSQCIDISALLCLCCLLDIPLRHEGVAVSDPRKM